MKKFVFVLGVVMVIVSCDKAEMVKVNYRVSKGYSETGIFYRNSEGQVVSETALLESPEDVWTFTSEMERGEIVYLSAIYSDSASSVDVQIKLDGKIYKANSSVNEPEQYVTVSGTIPF